MIILSIFLALLGLIDHSSNLSILSIPIFYLLLLCLSKICALVVNYFFPKAVLVSLENEIQTTKISCAMSMSNISVLMLSIIQLVLICFVIFILNTTLYSSAKTFDKIFVISSNIAGVISAFAMFSGRFLLLEIISNLLISAGVLLLHMSEHQLAQVCIASSIMIPFLFARSSLGMIKKGNVFILSNAHVALILKLTLALIAYNHYNYIMDISFMEYFAMYIASLNAILYLISNDSNEEKIYMSLVILGALIFFTNIDKYLISLLVISLIIPTSHSKLYNILYSIIIAAIFCILFVHTKVYDINSSIILSSILIVYIKMMHKLKDSANSSNTAIDFIHIISPTLIAVAIAFVIGDCPLIKVVMMTYIIFIASYYSLAMQSFAKINIRCGGANESYVVSFIKLIKIPKINIPKIQYTFLDKSKKIMHDTLVDTELSMSINLLLISCMLIVLIITH